MIVTTRLRDLVSLEEATEEWRQNPGLKAVTPHAPTLDEVPFLVSISKQWPPRRQGKEAQAVEKTQDRQAETENVVITAIIIITVVALTTVETVPTRIRSESSLCQRLIRP